MNGTHEFLQRDLDYVIRLDEVMWGCLLVAGLLSFAFSTSVLIALSPHLIAQATREQQKTERADGPNRTPR